MSKALSSFEAWWCGIRSGIDTNAGPWAPWPPIKVAHDIWEAAYAAAKADATRICDSRSSLLSSFDKTVEANEAHKCGTAIGGMRPDDTLQP